MRRRIGAAILAIALLTGGMDLAAGSGYEATQVQAAGAKSSGKSIAKDVGKARKNSMTLSIDGEEDRFYIAESGTYSTGTRWYKLYKNSYPDWEKVYFKLNSNVPTNKVLNKKTSHGSDYSAFAIEYSTKEDGASYTAGYSKGKFTVVVDENKSKGQKVKGRFEAKAKGGGKTVDISGRFDLTYGATVSSAVAVSKKIRSGSGSDSTSTESANADTGTGTSTNTSKKDDTGTSSTSTSKSGSTTDDATGKTDADTAGTGTKKTEAKTRNCTACGGRGVCWDCKGAGSVRCTRCWGNGKCSFCTGDGRIFHRVIPARDSYWSDCPQCDRGKCRTCDGDGDVRCDKCGGTGTCRYCNGTGDL